MIPQKITVCCIALAVSIAACAQQRLYNNEFPLGDIELLDGPFKKARDLNINTLLQYKPDRLLAPFCKQAGLQPRDSSYANWDGLDGHIGGHYLTAMAINAATGNTACRQRMEYMIAALKTCQDANTKDHPDWGKGYVGGVPNSQAVWTSVKQGDLKAFNTAWVPWYNVHKLYAGLRDAWVYAGNADARDIFLRFCDWAIQITADLTDDQMQSMLDTEHGGMNEVLADAYQITGDTRYLSAAKRFSHAQLLDPMSSGIDNLDNKHANTQVPKAIGFARIGELCDDPRYEKAGSFFWQTVTTHRTLAFGGNSRREFFPGAAACTDFISDVEGPESCNSNNMLKLTEDLFRMDPQAKYADYYERTILNHILSTQKPGTGGYVYFTPVRPRSYRVYSAPNEAMWCCVGTGMENHGKYNEFIYTHRSDSLYINLFMASVLNWKDKGIRLRQETLFPYEEETRFTITQAMSSFTMMIRYPGWVKKGTLKITINGKSLPSNNVPSSYIAIRRHWKKGDVVTVKLPMQNTIEHLPHVPAYIAILHGPVLLGAKTGTEDMKGLIADDSRWGHIPGGEKLPVDKAPIIVADDLSAITGKLLPVKDRPLHFTMPGVKLISAANIELQPFYQIHDARYMMYWMALSGTQYDTYLDSLSTVEKENLTLQRKTTDLVAPGEQQPEADHALQSEASRKGNAQDRFFREASDNGYFSYNLATAHASNLNLIMRYWGAEWGNRKFTIYIDDQKLITEDNTGRWNQSKFFDISYRIPDTLLKNKDHIRIKIQAAKAASTSPVYYIRLVRNEQQHSDNGDGTYTNPLIPADFPDPDVIRVGDTYYMVTTTMFVFPGVTVLRSHDLVNWEYCSNAVPRFDFGKCYNLDSCSRYGHGQWATSIKYHNGKFYLLFITLNEGGFMCTADKAEGPWHITHLPKGFYDPGLFFDDDGKAYVAQGYSRITITAVNDSLVPIGPDSLVYVGDIRKGLEGTHLYKLNGYYYMYSTYGGPDGIQVALRSRNIYGPYEQKIVLRDTTPGINFGVHQGALIQTQTGEWWTILFVDSGPFGRFPSLQPVKWEHDWPVAGVDGHGVITYKKPDVGATYPISEFPTSDEFDAKELGMQWGWNHNPDSTKWSLTKKPGYLRLATGKIASNLMQAVNTLTQRPFAKRDQTLPTIATTKLETDHMKDGDIAGLAVLQIPYAYIGVKRSGKSWLFTMVNNGSLIDSVRFHASTVYLRTIASNATRQATFEYSTDNNTFKPLGDTLKMQFSLNMFTGNKFCLFNYPTRTTGGYVDVDWFRVE